MTCHYAYGNIRATTGTLPTDFTFTGQRRDASAGLMYYGARYYDSTLGRFITADTIVPQAGNPQALNRYSYVGNNPLKYTDPSGHCWGVASGARSLPSYDVTCGNLDMALTIVQHPNANAAEKAFAGWYIATEGTAHVALAVGSSVLAWQVIAPAAAAGEAACADGDCTNEARAATHAVELTAEEAKNIATASQTASQSGTTVLGTFRTPFATTEIPEIASKRAFFWETASEIRANAMQVPDSIWNSLSRSSQWLVNKSFLDLAIQRGDRFRLAASYGDSLRRYIQLRAEGVQFDMMPGFIKELVYAKLKQSQFEITR